MSRAITDMREAERDLCDALATVREALAPADGTVEDYALCAVECFCDIALRVMKKTNPSKIRSETRTVEVKARLDGKPFIHMADVRAAAITGQEPTTQEERQP